jgi:hypothetical protein
MPSQTINFIIFYIGFAFMASHFLLRAQEKVTRRQPKTNEKQNKKY